MKLFEWGLIAAVLMAFALTWVIIKVDEACVVSHLPSFTCDVAHGFVRIMAPEVRP